MGAVKGFAKIKYLSFSDRVEDIVGIEKILFQVVRAPLHKEVRIPFVRQDHASFKSNYVYLVKTSRKSVDGLEHFCFCQIGAMAANQTDKELTKRISWPAVKDALLYDIEPDTTDAESSDTGLTSVLNERSSSVNASKLSANVQRQQLKKLIDNGRIQVSKETGQDDMAAKLLELQKQLESEREMRMKAEAEKAKALAEKAKALAEKAEVESKLSSGDLRLNSGDVVTMDILNNLLDQKVEAKFEEHLKGFHEKLDGLPAALSAQIDLRKSCMDRYQHVVEWLNNMILPVDLDY